MEGALTKTILFGHDDRRHGSRDLMGIPMEMLLFPYIISTKPGFNMEIHFE